MKKWTCSLCGREVLAFEEDILTANEGSYFEVKKGKPMESHKCEFPLNAAVSGNPSLLHGEAGFLVEGTVFDSINTIHEHETIELQKAEDNRELKSYLKAMKDS